MRNRQNDSEQREKESRLKDFLDMVAPSIIRFLPEHYLCGNTFRCVWALREYPTSTDEQALLRGLGEKDGVTLRIYTRQVTWGRRSGSSGTPPAKTGCAALTRGTSGRR